MTDPAEDRPHVHVPCAKCRFMEAEMGDLCRECAPVEPEANQASFGLEALQPADE
jgi:hypothetical protein